MSNTVLGLDLGTNSIGWALLEESNNKPQKIINLGSRIFIKAVEEKTPTPKNVKRREARMSRRIIQRRARRKQRLLNYLVSLDLLPNELKESSQPELILNVFGNPYALRALALDKKLLPHHLGRTLLHLVQRRGFLSSRKSLLGDMVDDPDVQVELEILEAREDNDSESAKEEGEFKNDIKQLRLEIEQAGYRTLGEYFNSLDFHDCKRNRIHNGGHLRTDRQMYQEELDLIWAQQCLHHSILTDEVKAQIEHIIFYQRPLKLKADRIGQCSLEPKNKRAKMARLEVQRFRYLQDINNLQYFNPLFDNWQSLDAEQRKILSDYFERHEAVSFAQIKNLLGFKKTEFNLEQGVKKLKGNLTACKIRKVFAGWDELSTDKQTALVEDLLTIQKKSVLKKRLMNHWQFSASMAVSLCLLEFEAAHASLSLKAINKLLPFLEQGQIYSDARVSAGYGYEVAEIRAVDKLGLPPEIPNPIVSKALHELRRLVNAIIAEYGKPDVIRVEMARDLGMGAKRLKDINKQQAANTKANDKAEAEFKSIVTKNPQLGLREQASRADKLKYRLWLSQNKCCAYSGKPIALASLFTAEIEVDHIIPYSQSLDDSFMNKVVCFAAQNQFKGQRTPIDAFSGQKEKWLQITQALKSWDKGLKSKQARFFMTAADVVKRGFVSSQLNDTRYISKVAFEYVKSLGCDVSVTKGIMTSWLRHQWDLNSLLSEDDNKDRSDHRHHAIDALVTACINRSFYADLVKMAKSLENCYSEFKKSKLPLTLPWANLREDLKVALEEVIIAHAPLLKLSGELHKDTGAGFIEGKGTVQRKNLSSYFEKVTTQEKARKVLKKIVDPTVALIMEEQLKNHNYDGKVAFANDKKVYHKDGKTLISRIRIFQSQDIKKSKQLATQKFAAKNKQGEVFKWYSYGNIHHLELIKNKQSNVVSGVFVTMWEAHRRAMTGTKSAVKRGVEREAVINQQHGDDVEFLMALHKQDIVSLKMGDKRHFYQVKRLGTMEDGLQPRVRLEPHTLAKGNVGIITDSIKNMITKYDMQLHKVNILGKLL